ncbi:MULTISPECIES: DUF61 family protein [unclassified Archaeoglobus]|jgi:hypothetical protein|uniref:DUF61 family protein n=1 Tax=unclassified Archaeoglobus TaxID=2643606 RepID=UPI0025C14948|nr:MULTISPECIES: DUF61 family protein [unclassified Archaeoglobus]
MNEKMLAKMIEAVNKHMPAKTRNLAEMLKEKDPMIRAKDGNEYYVEKKELEFIAKHVDELDWAKFRIPIILEMNDIGGERVIYVRDKLHAEFIKKAFGYDRILNGVFTLYMYELPEIRRKLRTASQIIFRISLK